MIWMMVLWLFGLVVFCRTPPVCPPRSPSPWPSPAERERGYVLSPRVFLPCPSCFVRLRAGALKWPLSGWLLPLRLFRGAGRSSSFGFGYVAI